jgi:hypothetical protein
VRLPPLDRIPYLQQLLASRGRARGDGAVLRVEVEQVHVADGGRHQDVRGARGLLHALVREDRHRAHHDLDEVRGLRLPGHLRHG